MCRARLSFELIVVDALRISIESDADIARARRLGRAFASTLPFTTSELSIIATAIAELARNIVSFATQGEIRLTVLRRGGREGLKIVAQDSGPGIHDPALVLRDGFSTAGRPGLGLSGLKRLVDEFEISSQVGVGTSVTVHKWAR